MARDGETTRRQILQAALKQFAQKGYAGTTIRDILRAARVTAPVLYYYFRNKADLYCALVDLAAEERMRLMREAAARADSLVGKLKEICLALFEFAKENVDLMRLAFVTALAAPGEVPKEAHGFEKGWESIQFIQELLEGGLRRGELSARFDGRTLAVGFWGLIHIHVATHLVRPSRPLPLDKRTAESVVELFIRGAASGAEAQCVSGGAKGCETKK
ncbi:MAG: TetR/AcrR family transcriptional regulator [Verrucomicrobiales bacterium]|nr:TetR/AcrR family transcriptional regulator [Verrucomicrobiales bacterium]